MKERRRWFVKYAAALGFLAVGVLVGFLLGQRVPVTSAPTAPSPTVGQSNASLMFDFGDGTVRTFPVALTPGERLFDALKQVTHESNTIFTYKDFSGLGVLVEQIGSKANTSDRFWQYWVNNRYAQVGADAYVVQAGDTIEWKYTAPQPTS